MEENKGFKRFKVIINSFMDQIIIQCNLILMNASRLPLNGNNKLVEKLTRSTGKICLFIQFFPRLSIFQLTTEEWKIHFIGDQNKLETIKQLFFPGKSIRAEEIGRIPLWKIKTHTDLCLDNDVDLIICEKPGLQKLTPKTRSFIIPEWVAQILDLPETASSLLDGKRKRNKRNMLNRAEKLEFDWEYSHKDEDFEYFHKELYLPYITNRHQELAVINSYAAQYECWFQRGGLILVRQNEKLVAGILCRFARGIFYGIELGFQLDEQMRPQTSVPTYLEWAAIQKAYQFKAKQVEWGGSKPLLSDGTLKTKRNWGAKVIRRKKIVPYFQFSWQNLPNDLREHLNKLEIISETKTGFFRAFIHSDDKEIENKTKENLIINASNSGINGVQFF